MPSRKLWCASFVLHRDFSQGYPLDSRPDDGQATHLSREHVDLVGALPDIAEQTLVWHWSF